MSTDELKRKTVCLKLAKNGIYLCKNPSNVKFVSSKDLTSGLKQLKELSQQSKVEPVKLGQGVVKQQPPPELPRNKEPQEESVLQKFIRGFDCNDFCDDEPSYNLGECSSTSEPTAREAAEAEGRPPTDPKVPGRGYLTGGSRPRCRVEFVTPTKADNAPTENLKPVKPLIVDLSQKKILLKDNPIKIVKSTPSELRQLNRNFITPKVKVENYSDSCDSTSLPLIISPAETPDMAGRSRSQSPYPSTKIEIDYTGSSILNSRYSEPDFPRTAKSELSEFTRSPKLIFGQENESRFQENDSFNDAYRNFNNMIHQHSFNNMTQQHQNRKINNQHMMYSNLSQQHPYKTGSQPHQSLVMGKCGGEGVSPMVNPQILEIDAMAEVVMSSANRAEQGTTVQPPRKKRKYTRRATQGPSDSRLPRTAATTYPTASSVLNFLSSL